MGKFRSFTLLLAGSSLFVATMALTAPSGGGGGAGGSMPSASAPSFDVAAEYRKGVEALQAKQYADAKKSFDKVLTAAPSDANTNYLSGLTAVGLGNAKAARRFYERAVRSDNEMVAAHRELGLVYSQSGEWPKARKELEALKAMGEKCGAGCAKSAEISEAINALSAAVAGAPQSRLESKPSLIFTSTAAGDHAYLEAVSLINEGRYQDAIAAFEASQRAFGPHPDILTYLGFANRKLGRIEIAQSYYRQALEAAPGHRGATEYYGELLVERGDKAGAETMLASLESSCTFGCAEADELRRWIEAGHAPAR
jgi:tetratricopeptide (TPR) repeat protein